MKTTGMVAVLLILLGGGCAGRRLADDPRHPAIPLGTAAVISRCFDPVLRPFLEDLRISSFDNTNCSCAGYYFPVTGVHVAIEEVGHLEFELTLTHELLHAVHFNGLIDKDLFNVAVKRLLADKAQDDFVKQVHHLPWNNVANLLFRQSEYFARIGEAIIQRRGIDVPLYMLDCYRGILHPNVWANAYVFAGSPIPELARVECADGTILPGGTLLGHALRLYSKHEARSPRPDAKRFTVWLEIPFPEGLDRPTPIIWRRRSTRQTIAGGIAQPVVSGEQRRLECVWDLAQAQAILQAHLDMDMFIEIFDPIIALKSPHGY